MNAKIGKNLLLLVVIGCACSVFQPTPTQQEAQPMVIPSPTLTLEPGKNATFTELKEDVRSRENESAELSPASMGQVIYAGGGAQTGEPGWARLDIMPEETILRMGPSTQFNFVELKDDPQTPFSRLQLFAGQVWIILNGGSLEVETPLGISAVRGSLMGVWYDPSLSLMSATCLEGNCSLANDAGKTDMTGGQASDISGAGQAPSPARDFYPGETLGWLWNNPESSAFTSPPVQLVDIPHVTATTGAVASGPVASGTDVQAGQVSMAGTIYWSPQLTNWFIVLDTWVRGSQQEWVDSGVTNWLMHQPGPLDGVADPMASDVNFNVLTYDPTGHGADMANSQLPFSKVGPLWEQDAASTGGLNYLGASTDPAANYAMMNNSKYIIGNPCSIYVGASTGADRALQSCAANPAGCAGMVSLSPGGYLGTSYENELKKYFAAWDAYKQAGDFSKLCPALDPAGAGASIHCVASKSDRESANTCAPFSKVDTVNVHLLDQPGHGLSYFFDKNGAVIDMVRQIILDEVQENQR